MPALKILLASLITTMWIGCYSNEICIDPLKKVILNPSHHNLSRLEIEFQEGDKTAFLDASLKSRAHEDKFLLTMRNPDFEIRDYLENECSFLIRPNTVYKITNSSNGDAADNSVTFQTDSFNNIFVVEGDSCELR